MRNMADGQECRANLKIGQLDSRQASRQMVQPKSAKPTVAENTAEKEVKQIKRPEYTEEDKKAAVERVMQNDGKIKDTAAELGIDMSILCLWVKEFLKKFIAERAATRINPDQRGHNLQAAHGRAIAELVAENEGNVAQTARELGLSIATVDRQAIKSGIDMEQLRNNSKAKFIEKIGKLLVKNKGNASQTARDLGIGNDVVNRRVKKSGVDVEQLKKDEEKEFDEKIRELLVKNKGNAAQTAKELGVGEATIDRYAKKLKIDMRQLRKDSKEESVEKIMELYVKNKGNAAQTGRELGLHRATVNRLVKEYMEQLREKNIGEQSGENEVCIKLVTGEVAMDRYTSVLWGGNVDNPEPLAAGQ